MLVVVLKSDTVFEFSKAYFVKFLWGFAPLDSHLLPNDPNCEFLPKTLSL